MYVPKMTRKKNWSYTLVRIYFVLSFIFQKSYKTWRFMGIDGHKPEDVLLNFVKSESKFCFVCLSWKLHTEKNTLDKQTEVFSFLLEPWSIHVVCKSDRATNNIKKTHKWRKTCKTIKENRNCKIRRLMYVPGSYLLWKFWNKGIW